MKSKIFPFLLSITLIYFAKAHHGVASLGAAGLEGPGSPIETSSSATLPEGKFLAYLKLDYAKFKKYTPEVDQETDSYIFWIYGLGYGIKQYLSIYLFVPYYTKKVEDNSFNTSGFADLSITAVLGFKYDEGLHLIPKYESLDDLQDWHFTFYSGVSLPTGNPDIRDAYGSIDPGMSLGFGEPSVTLGLTATKQLTDDWTVVFDTSFLKFFEHTYSDGTRYKFGDEFRFNTAYTYRAYTNENKKLRLDANMEFNYLYLNRDKENGINLTATGGQILYLLPGIRLYYRNVSVGTGIKFPIWKNLNEEAQQQGSEGKEKYRIIFTFSSMF